jgi:hypothetical protein
MHLRTLELPLLLNAPDHDLFQANIRNRDMTYSVA